jgi:glycogen(starch) synthase
VRILSIGSMYPPHHLGGAELAWRSAVHHLRDGGHEVRVLATDFAVADPDLSLPEDPDVHRELQWYWRDHAFPRLSLRERLALERNNAEVLRGHVGEFAPEAVLWSAMGGMSLSLIERVRRDGIPAVGTVYDDWMVYGPKVDAWQRACRRLGALANLVSLASRVPASVDLGAAGRWIFISEAVRRGALSAGWRLPDTVVAHPGIDSQLFRPAPEKAWRGRLLCVGRLDPRKGIETAIRALAALPEATLTVVSGADGVHVSRLRSLVGELGLEGRVELDVRRREQVPAAYAEADALLFPVTWAEPWGLVPLEAMAVGTPVVATGTGGSGEYLRDGENCLIFEPPDDPLALAGAVRKLAADEELRRRLRDGGFETAARFAESSFNRAVEGALVETAE